MIWHGLRPQWLPKLQERATQSQWSQTDLGRFIQGQNNTPPLWLRVNPLLQDDSTDALKNLQQQLLMAASTANCAKTISMPWVARVQGARAVPYGQNRNSRPRQPASRLCLTSTAWR